MEFGINRLAKVKTKGIKGYQAEILTIGGSILIHRIHKLFNLAVKKSFPDPWSQPHFSYFYKRG